MTPELLSFIGQPLAMDRLAMKAIVTSQLGQVKPAATERPEPEFFCLNSSKVRNEANLGNTDADNYVAVVPLWGPLSMHGGWFSQSTEEFSSVLRRLDKNPAVTGIVISVNSPGGTVTGTQEAAMALRDVRQRGTTDTIAVVNPMMASAASWIATAAQDCADHPKRLCGVDRGHLVVRRLVEVP